MKKFALIAFVFIYLGDPALAKPFKPPQNSPTVSASWPISCHTVRVYIKQVGLERARSMALAAGMTPAQAQEARRCLVKPI